MKSDAVINEGVYNGIVIVVALVWATIALSTIITSDFTALGAVTPVMMIVVGFLYGYRREDKVIQNGNKEHKGTKEPDRRSDLSDW